MLNFIGAFSWITLKKLHSENAMASSLLWPTVLQLIALLIYFLSQAYCIWKNGADASIPIAESKLWVEFLAGIVAFGLPQAMATTAGKSGDHVSLFPQIPIVILVTGLLVIGGVYSLTLCLVSDGEIFARFVVVALGGLFLASYNCLRGIGLVTLGLAKYTFVTIGVMVVLSAINFVFVASDPQNAYMALPVGYGLGIICFIVLSPVRVAGISLSGVFWSLKKLLPIGAGASLLQVATSFTTSAVVFLVGVVANEYAAWVSLMILINSYLSVPVNQLQPYLLRSLARNESSVDVKRFATLSVVSIALIALIVTLPGVFLLNRLLADDSSGSLFLWVLCVGFVIGTCLTRFEQTSILSGGQIGPMLMNAAKRVLAFLACGGIWIVGVPFPLPCWLVAIELSSGVSVLSVDRKLETR